ncbi:hypothetical protein NHX12_019436 [Muraenolepis orangiensis]|uniref:Uncharacterized protein n=1 Tax=Muraenolepis orangiensis TaxID=630683 RepID=A0A9Q0ETD5_9TELE|nr:hypothetical protein NHX12_019436 [Muraenolepis orangiensis]
MPKASERYLIPVQCDYCKRGGGHLPSSIRRGGGGGRLLSFSLSHKCSFTPTLPRAKTEEVQSLKYSSELGRVWSHTPMLEDKEPRRHGSN